MACLRTQRMTTIDSLELVGPGSAVGRGGLKLKAIASGSMKRQHPGPVPESVSHSCHTTGGQSGTNEDK
jgi:hypothetical protein